MIVDPCVYPENLAADLPWSEQPPEVAFETMGLEYLKLILAPGDVALYRIIIRDSARFPQLSECYRTKALLPRQEVFAAYLDRWSPRREWRIRDVSRAVSTFFALLRRDLVDAVLLGGPTPTDADVGRHVTFAASDMLTLIEGSAFAGAPDRTSA